MPAPRRSARLPISTPSSTPAARASTPRTTCPAPSTGRRWTTRSGTRSAPCTSRSTPSRRASAAPRWWRATSRATSQREVMDKPKGWQPLVYCWRGGQRSGALSLVLGQIGFRGAHRRRRLQGVPRRRAGANCRSWRSACRLPRGLRPHRFGQDAPAAGAGRPPARRCWTWKALASHRSSVLGLIPGPAAAGAEALRHAGVGEAARASTPRGRSTSRAKAARSATWPCPTR